PIAAFGFLLVSRRLKHNFNDVPSSLPLTTPICAAPIPLATTEEPIPLATTEEKPSPLPPPPPETASAENTGPAYSPTVQPRPTKAPEIGVTRTPVTRSPISVAPQPRGPRTGNR